MKLDAVILADAVATPNGDKFFIHGGGITRIEVPELPADIPFQVLARFKVEPDDRAQEHGLEFVLIGPQGIPNVDPIQLMAVPPAEEPDLAEGEEEYLNLPVEVPAFALREGLYQLEIYIGKEMARRLPLPVIEVGKNSGPIYLGEPPPNRPSSKARPKARKKASKPPSAKRAKAKKPKAKKPRT